MSEKVFTGTVCWFNSRLGTGFILRDDGKTDIFVHYSDIIMEGFKVLMAGDKVSFVEDMSFKNKLKAGKVTLLERKNETRK